MKVAIIHSALSESSKKRSLEGSLMRRRYRNGYAIPTLYAAAQSNRFAQASNLIADIHRESVSLLNMISLGNWAVC